MNYRQINTSKVGRALLLFCLSMLFVTNLLSQSSTDSAFNSRPYIYQLSIEGRPGYIFRINPFLKGENMDGQPIKHLYSTHLKYSFQFQPTSYVNKIYRGVYQGIGLSHYNFGKSTEIGNPLALYLFQGATITQFSPRLSLNYEWNFGLSAGWKPYDKESNPNNGMIGSKLNAYMNANFYLKHRLSTKFDLIAGGTLTHFSNGNTKFPNAGLNAIDAKVGLVYNLNGHDRKLSTILAHTPLLINKFPKHISTDVVLYGSWRNKGILFNETPLASPDTYHVFGFNVNPMYNMNYNLRFGLSLDGVYDSSANVYTEDYIVSAAGDNPGYTFYKPSIEKQLALGISARGEYVMPYFTVGLGIGTNVLHGGEDFKGFYQILALKIEVTRSSFIHIGYNLKDFKEPNYLMLGIGYRFGNRYPCFYR
ncbi:MAG: acyloxyacyl hydrolase [Bacteroidales bacterium]|nr:acyloxyacyl hydrolase [Bacteroidales bacterium]